MVITKDLRIKSPLDLKQNHCMQETNFALYVHICQGSEYVSCKFRYTCI